MAAAPDTESDIVMPCLPSAYRGPAIVMVVGCSFGMLGAIPVSITMALGIRTSATIIGMGFVGFGMMLLLPGCCWCIIVHHNKYSTLRRRPRLGSSFKGQEETPALRDSNQSHYGVMVNEVSVVDRLPDKGQICDNNSHVCS
ncbi:hypothetical protein LSH36_388g00009 [Paralvinella palmiformis]|uniref:Uncharacterized protein n=1 Tax=Paralvinella palmiformis TaxID=53620 RepID=A0AAD9JCY5_9ANNE|nr:hypothetical protein LSH36_388g00009 [Paralvinella palmiformis]